MLFITVTDVHVVEVEEISCELIVIQVRWPISVLMQQLVVSVPPDTLVQDRLHVLLLGRRSSWSKNARFLPLRRLLWVVNKFAREVFLPEFLKVFFLLLFKNALVNW